MGRQEGVDLFIKHDSISRRHAEISYANGHYILRDLASRNGTFVNKQRIAQGNVHVLNLNDEVSFGKIAFRIQSRQVDASSSVLLKRPKKPEYPKTEVVSSHIQCQACGASIHLHARFCTVCGKPQAI